MEFGQSGQRQFHVVRIVFREQYASEFSHLVPLSRLMAGLIRRRDVRRAADQAPSPARSKTRYGSSFGSENTRCHRPRISEQELIPRGISATGPFEQTKIPAGTQDRKRGKVRGCRARANEPGNRRMRFPVNSAVRGK